MKRSRAGSTRGSLMLPIAWSALRRTAQLSSSEAVMMAARELCEGILPSAAIVHLRRSAFPVLNARRRGATAPPSPISPRAIAAEHETRSSGSSSAVLRGPTARLSRPSPSSEAARHRISGSGLRSNLMRGSVARLPMILRASAISALSATCLSCNSRVRGSTPCHLSCTRPIQSSFALKCRIRW